MTLPSLQTLPPLRIRLNSGVRRTESNDMSLGPPMSLGQIATGYGPLSRMPASNFSGMVPSIGGRHAAAVGPAIAVSSESCFMHTEIWREESERKHDLGSKVFWKVEIEFFRSGVPFEIRQCTKHACMSKT